MRYAASFHKKHSRSINLLLCLHEDDALESSRRTAAVLPHLLRKDSSRRKESREAGKSATEFISMKQPAYTVAELIAMIQAKLKAEQDAKGKRP